MRYLFLLISIGALSISNIGAQNISEALRYSTYNYGSTARALGSGAAFSAIGADLSVASTNPAGLAEFRKSEFAFTGDLANLSTEAILAGASAENSNKAIFNLEQIGAVFHKRPTGSFWTTSNLVLNFNRLANFDANISYRGTTDGSIVERFVERANGLEPNQLDNFEAGLAYDAIAIFDDDQDLFYESDFGNFNLPVSKGQEITRRGGLSEFSVSYAGAIKNKLLVGLGVGIPIINFDESKAYFERDVDGSIDFFDELIYEETLQTTGLGLNARLGVIYKVNNNIRLSGAIHTPTTYFLTDDFTTDLQYRFTDPGVNQTGEQLSPEGTFEYRVQTPFRSNVGAGYLFRSGEIMGFVSGEVEFVDFSSNSFDISLDVDLQDDLNREIDQSYKSATNIRFGTELIYRKLVVRAGYNINGNQFTVGDNSASIWSAGIGFRKRNFYIDAAFQHTDVSDDYTPYFLLDTNRNQNVSIRQSIDKLRLTVGFKFD